MYKKAQIKPFPIDDHSYGTDYSIGFDKAIHSGFFDLSIEQFMIIQQALLSS